MDVSVVIPVFNERENLRPLHAELTEAMARLGRSYEVLYVDDGSTDGSRDVLLALVKAASGNPPPTILPMEVRSGWTL